MEDPQGNSSGLLTHIAGLQLRLMSECRALGGEAGTALSFNDDPPLFHRVSNRSSLVRQVDHHPPVHRPPSVAVYSARTNLQASCCCCGRSSTGSGIPPSLPEQRTSPEVIPRGSSRHLASLWSFARARLLRVS